MNQACVSCHKEIGALVAEGRGLHARDAKSACASCHPDHAGVDFALVKWPEGSPERFDHRKAGWALEGKHAETKCTACHKSEFRTGKIASLSPRKHGAGWVGLEQTCTSCHEDPHRTALGIRCTDCHDIAAWKPAKRFSHDSTSYPLTGKHADVSCAKCHEAAWLTPVRNAKGDVVPVFKPVSHKDCADCHTDPHRGRLAGTCVKCHVTTNFLTINKKEFDHDATRYPLRGRHVAVACANCHAGFPSQGMRPAFATCANCHADVHGGKATLAGRTSGCDACHTLEGFKPATYAVAQHAKSAYPLEGKHAAVKCGACHVTRTTVGAAGAAGASVKFVEMRPAYAACANCHADDHGGQLSSRADKGACESCHKTAAWTQTAYPVPAHATLRLALDGRHAEIPCGACHSAKRTGLRPMPATRSLGKAQVAFKLNDVECAACHLDPHQGRLAKYGRCGSCHDARHFRPSTYDVAAHAKGPFALDGAHRAVPCVNCHAEMKASPMKSSLVPGGSALTAMPFTAKHERCAACHADPHGTQFAARKDKGACEGCHDLESFVPASRFDHGHDASFPLTGGHAGLQCAQCHKQSAGAAKAAIDYHGLSPKCESCHTQPVRQ